MREVVSSQFHLSTLSNPFDVLDVRGNIIGHVSGRSTDIRQIISEGQSEIVLAGAPTIGKSTLVNYLQLPPYAEWSWRNELTGSFDQQKLNITHFVQINLAHLEGIEDKNDLLNAFINRCASALYQVYKKEKSPSDTMSLKKLVDLLREISHDTPNARYFLMLDTIERLGRFGLSSFAQPSKAQRPQEYGLALLNHSNAIRTIVDLIGEFRVLGFILSIENLPRSKVVDQFTHISADLARFTTTTLQTFTWQDTGELLAQEPANFSKQLADTFEHAGITKVFSDQEQKWLRQQAGTHPYLLQQLCFYAFHLKQEQVKLTGEWTELENSVQQQAINWLKERLSTFFANTWNRLEEAIQSDSQTRPKTISDFQEFIELLNQPQQDVVIRAESWNSWGPEFRYILYSEGIVRYDPLQPIYAPGEVLRHYLIQKNHEMGAPVMASSISHPMSGKGYWVTINRGAQKEQLSLSELEYHLFKTLLQHPKNCTDSELMFAAWGRTIDRQTFMQRMYHLRKKLRDRCEMEIIENRYGGLYSLNYPEWFQLD
jgi:hypothetical protein